jgi:hypothetical protein
VTKAYVETTVLADALLKPGPRAAAAKAAIGRYDQSSSPWCKSGFRNEKDCVIYRDDS